MVRTGDEHTDRTEATSDTNKKKREPGRLTPMPDCLMHWWIPFALAVILFLGSMFITSIWGSATFDEIMQAIHDCPMRWPFRIRTPSREEIEVCLTITAASFAFSAWQQRNHDNIAREKDALAKQEAEKTARETAEKNRSEQIERDEYWKRRERAYALLSSNNPNIRLGAIELLIELGDIATKSNTETLAKTQEFLQHIVTTLCNQVRYEGLNIDADGTLEQHAFLQGQIIQKLLKRANNSSINNRSNGWPRCTIDISDSILNIEIEIHNTTIKWPLILTGTTFNKPVNITRSSLHELHWTNSRFNHLTIANSSLKIDSFPTGMKNAEFSHTTLGSQSHDANSTITLRLTNAKSNPTLINSITFNQDCSFTSPLLISAKSNTKRPNFSSEHLIFQNCNFAAVEITGATFNAGLLFEECIFNDILNIHELLYELGAVSEHDCEENNCEKPYPYCLENWKAAFPFHATSRTAYIIFSNCLFPNDATENILAKGITCIDDIDDVINHDLIILTNSRTHDGDEVIIEFLERDLDEGSTYITKVIP